MFADTVSWSWNFLWTLDMLLRFNLESYFGMETLKQDNQIEF